MKRPWLLASVLGLAGLFISYHNLAPTLSSQTRLVRTAHAQIDTGGGAAGGITGGASDVSAGASGTVGSGSSSGTTNSDAGPAAGTAFNGKGLAAYIGDPSGFVYKSWRVSRGIINILLIIALLIISFSNITRVNLDNYTVKKALPNLVLGVILANASFLIIRYIADIVTVFTYLFVELGVGKGQTFAHFLTVATTTIGIEAFKNIGWGPSVALGPITILIIFLLGIITVIAFLWLAFLLYFRLVVIYLLTILAPLAFIAYGLPGLDQYFKKWWQQFIKWVFILPAMAAVFWLMIEIGRASSDTGFAKILIMYVLFYTALTIPTKFGGQIVAKASGAFMKYTGAGWAKDASIKLASEQAGNAGKLVLSRTPGVYRMQEWNKQRKENFEKDLAVRRKQAGTRAGSGVIGKQAATLQYRENIAGNVESRVKAEQAEKALTTELANHLNVTDFEKIIAEKLHSKRQHDEKLKFFSRAAEKDANDNIVYKDLNSLVKNFARASSEENARAEALSTEEKIIIGGHTNERLEILRLAKSHGELEKQLEELDTMENEARLKLDDIKNRYGVGSTEYRDASRDYNVDRAARIDLQRETASDLAHAYDIFEAKKTTHADLKGKTVTDVAREIDKKSMDGKIFEAEMRKQAVSYNAGIEAQSEDMRKNGSARLLVRDNQKFVQPSPEFEETLRKLASGRTVGLDVNTQRDFDLFVHTAKSWLQSNRNPNYNATIDTLLTTLVKQGKQEISYMKKNGKNPPTKVAINASNIGDYVGKMDTLNQDEKANIVKSIYQMPAVGGSPAQHVQSVPGPENNS